MQARSWFRRSLPSTAAATSPAPPLLKSEAAPVDSAGTMRAGAAHNRLHLLAVAALAVAALALVGCGSSSGTGSVSDATYEKGPPRGVVTVGYQEPTGNDDQIGEELLEASETKAVASALAKTFELPNPLT